MSDLRLALIGKNISHSRSKIIYESLLNHPIHYDLIDVDNIEDLPPLSQLQKKYHGVNITSPYKKCYAGQIESSDLIKRIGAINCLFFKENIILGTNTDFQAINDFFSVTHTSLKFHCIILGDGVMAKCTKVVLDEIGYTYEQYSRKSHGDITSLDLSGIVSSRKILVINCCSRDYLFQGKLPIYSWFWDFNYDFPFHQKTLPSQCELYVDGFALLKAQATYALKFWEL